MATVKFEIPDEQAIALEARATAQGLTLEGWFQKIAGQEAPTDQFQRAQAAATRILEIQARSRPDPEGWTIHEYINHDPP